MKKIFLFFAFIFISTICFSQLSYQWANSAGSSSSEYGQAIASDPSGNVYVTGLFIGIVDFDPSAATANLTSLSGSKDIFLAKYNSTGGFIWVKQIAGTNDEKPYDLVADASGVYLAGNFLGTVDFDPNAGVTNITSLGGGTDGDGFFAKYDVNGNLSWVNRIGSTVNDRITSVAIDASANVYITGYIGGNADMDPSAASANLNVSGTFNAFIGKYTSAGVYTFAKQITGGYSEGDDINVDASGNIYLTGSYATTNDFDPSAATANLSTSSLTQLDIFVAKYTSAGLYTFAKQIGGIGVDIGFQVMPDASGNIYLGGVFSSSCDFDPTAATSTLTSAGSGDLFVAKYDALGNLSWKTGTGGANNDYCYGLGLDAANNVYITGKVQGTNIDFDPSASSSLLTSASSCMYIASYNSSGNFLSVSSTGVASEAKGLCVNSSLYVTGMFAGTADLDFSAVTANVTSVGSDDIFFAKYNVSSCPVPAQPSAISGNFTVCSGTSNTYSVTNDPSATSYSWTFPVGWAGSSATNISAPTVSTGGIISVVATNSCGSSQAQTVNIVTGPSGASISTTSAYCGNGNGTATVTAVVDGVPPLLYSFNSGPFAPGTTQTNLVSGPKNVVIKDVNACTFTLNFNIGSTGSPSTSVVSLTNASCYNIANGGFSLSTTGGVPAYSYSLIPGNITSGTGAFANLTAQVYTVTAKDAVGCITTILVTISQSNSITINTSTISAACSQSNGAASATATGGTPAYTYTWSTGFVGQALTNIPAGTYTVQVKDANGCLSLVAATVPNASGPAVTITSFTNASCFNMNSGAATTSLIMPGTPGPGFPTYIWTNGQTTANATNLMVGVHSVTVTDAAGCKASTSVTIVQPSSLTLNVTGINPKCFNQTNGSANVSVSGGTPAYTYTWSPTPGAGANTSNPSGMGPGNHVVTVTDAMGCIITGTVGLANPAQMLAGVNSTNVSCFNICNGSAIASLTNAVGTVSYLWTGGASTLITQSVVNLCAGTYTMLATDQNSCTSTTIINITQPSLLSASIIAVGSVSCSGGNNGFATVSASGGTPAYTYSWSNSQISATATNLSAGSYTVMVTDSKFCTASIVTTVTQPVGMTGIATSTNVTCFNLNNGSAAITYTGGTSPYNVLWQPSLYATQNTGANLGPGTHIALVTDANGCSLSKTISIIQPPALVVNMFPGFTNCGQANGTVSCNASGGVGGYTYLWSTGPTYTNAIVSNVVMGSYTVTVKDANNCTQLAVTFINDIAAPTIVITNTAAVTCFGGSTGGATTSASGGFGPLSYLWSYLSQTTQNVTNLPAGVHTVTVSDQANCASSATVNITQAASSLVASVGSVTNVACNGNFNGAAQIIASGGAPNYNYLWSPSAQTNSVLTGIGAGIYTCSVTDVNGCVITKTVSITQPAPLLITTNTIVNPSCFNLLNGSIGTSISGGNPSYTINWTPVPASTQTVSNLGAGSYSLSVVDNKGCTTFSVYTITQPSSVTVVASITYPACTGPSGSCTVIIGGGTPAYTYSWSPITQTTNIATGLASGNYTFTAVDSKGCILVTPVTIPSATVPVVNAASSSSIICTGQTATLIASGANTYTWSTTATGSTIAVTPTTNTTYTLTGVGASGCSNSITVTQSVSLCTGINDFAEETSALKIYPNPFSEDVSITMDNFEKEFVLNIYNSIGQFVYKINISRANSVIDLTELPAGIYFVKPENSGEEKVIKLIKN